MANYISALNGKQMDSALMDVALRNPEAWAVGQRNGVPVTSADETWHNNAKYYAQVAQSAIPGTYTAAVRWDIAQGLAGEAQEQARANISAGASNRNLLDNPWFTVNQRGVSGTITNGEHGVDRWRAGGGTVTMATGRITLGAGNSFALQRTADPSIFNGKTVTLSVMTNDGVVESGTVVAQTGTAKTVQTTNFELCIGYTAYNSFYFYNTSSSAKTVIAAKLELGSYSTLANDIPPDYGEELRKCRRYFRRYAPNQTGLALIGRAGSTTEADFILGDEQMAKSTGITAAINGAVYVRAGDNTNHSVTSAVVQTSIGGGPALICATTGLTLGATAIIVFASGGYIDINGDL